MKIILNAGKVQASGYKNVNISKNLLTDFNTCAEASQLNEIYGPIALNSLGIDDIDKFLTTAYELLRPGGRLVIGGIDIYLMSASVVSMNKTLAEYNRVIFYPDAPQSFLSIGHVKTFLLELGFKIEDIAISQETFSFVIKATK